MSEENRMTLTEIEVEVIRYRDELELTECWLTVPERVERYRRKLLRNLEKKLKTKIKEVATPKPENCKRDCDKSGKRAEDISDDKSYEGQLMPRKIFENIFKRTSDKQNRPLVTDSGVQRSVRKRKYSNSAISSTSKYSPHQTSSGTSRQNMYSPPPVRSSKYCRCGRSPASTPPIRRRNRSTSRTGFDKF